MLSLLSLLSLKSVAPTLASVQFIFFILGLGLFWLISRFSYQFIENWRWPAYAVLCVLLIIPLIIGTTTRGIAGWIDIGTFFSIQPSQLAIPTVALLIGHILTTRPAEKWQTLAIVMTLILIPAGLIIVEPDLGTTVIYILAMGSVLFVSPIPLKYLGGLAALGVVAIILGWTFFLKDYQKARITGFANAGDHSQTANYNAQQSLIAVGSGQIMGRGLGQGVQSHLRFLPERQTDFIFASLAEELGLIGSVLVIGLYLGITLFCVYIAINTPHLNERYFCVAAAATILFQSGVNIGMNMGLLPITGITLPFLSYGGSSILSMCILLGVVQTIAQQTKRQWHLHLT